jgi:hypothetical protein
MTSEVVWPVFAAGGLLGCALGALAALLWRAKREQALRVEAELLREALASGQNLLSRETRNLVTALAGPMCAVNGARSRSSGWWSCPA